MVTDSPPDGLAGTVNRPAVSNEGLLEALGVSVGAELLERALMHRSFAYENGGLPTNERLEFLGDSVLGLIVTDTLFRSYPDLPEGQLAKLRAAVVNMRALAGVARGLNLGSYVRLGKGEEGTGGRDKSSILADTLEAVIGAVYLDQGLAAADGLVHRLFDAVIARSARLGAGLDWKTSLQELTAAEILGVPEYHVDESGPDHQKSFRAFVRIGTRTYGEGEGRSKKEAEQQAAEAAWNAITEGLAASDTQAAGASAAADQPATMQPAHGQDSPAAPPRAAAQTAAVQSAPAQSSPAAPTRAGTAQGGTDQGGTDQAATVQAASAQPAGGRRAAGRAASGDDAATANGSPGRA